MIVRVAVVSEDRSGREVVEQLVLAGARASGMQAVLEFRSADPGLGGLVHGSMWKSGRNTPLVAQWIATRIKEGFVVVFHYDADVEWPKEAPHRPAFARLVRAVAHVIDAGALVEAVPYTEIEGWTFRNTALALRLSDRHEAHARFAADPALLETTLELKELSPLGSAHNLTLVQRGWPHEAAYADGRSFRAFADALRKALAR